MLDLYKKRLQLNGGNMSNALKSQSNNMMNHSFKNGTSYKSVIIDGQNVDARFYSNNSYSIKSDAIDYKLQFRPHVLYPLGTYVSIQNEENEYEDWIIVGKNDDIMFPKFNILKCNYTLRWLFDYKIVEYKVALRDKTGGGSGLWNNNYMVTVDNQIAVWLPSTDDVQRLRYGDRFIITNNKINPVSFKISRADDVLSKGITKFILIQDELSSNDNYELMIADYYKSFPKDNGVNKTYSLVGTNTITTNSLHIYTVYDTVGAIVDEVKFKITDLEGNETNMVTSESVSNTIKISAKDIKGVFMLTADINGVIVTKEIRIKGLL